MQTLTVVYCAAPSRGSNVHAFIQGTERTLCNKECSHFIVRHSEPTCPSCCKRLGQWL